MTRFPFSRVLCALTLLAAGAAQAGSISVSECANSNVSGGAATDCQGYTKGNDSVSSLQELVGNTWHGLSISGLKQYKDETVGAGSTNVLFDVKQTGGDDEDASKGRLTFLQSITGPAVLTLKGGNNWAAYFLPNGGAAGTTISFDIPGKQGAGLSHASIYTAATPTGLSPTPSTPLPAVAVPEPSALALVLLALGGAAAAGTKRRRG